MNYPSDFRIIRSRRRRKTLSISVKHDGSIVIRVPFRLPEAEVDRFIAEKRAWVCKTLVRIAALGGRRKPKEFVSGESFSYLGNHHKLVISVHEDHESPLFFVDNTFHLDPRYRERGKDLFIAWYKEQAGVTIGERVQFYSRRMLVSPRGTRITSAKFRWGCCSAADSLTFTWRLIMAPLSIIDYLVVHELGHIKEKNHSSKFWKIVESILPDYRLRRDWLKKHGRLLDL